jgi:SAM-dependent methyltransferase
MGYRASFDCLWCGDAWTTRGPDDLEGWTQLCPTCLGRAGDNTFLRLRLRAGLAARGAGSAGSAAPAGVVAAAAVPAGARAPRPARRSSARAFPDDWFLRVGEFSQGAIHDAAWAAELDMVTLWLDRLPLTGRIVEPAAGVGYFSPLLAERGELFALDPDGEALDRARERLLAHRLRAHLHVADPWAASGLDAPDAPDAPGPSAARGLVADVVVASFLLGRVRGAGLDVAARSLRGRLRDGGLLAVIELLPDAFGGPPPAVPWSWHDPALVEAALARAGFSDLRVATTGRFFLTVSGAAG